MVFYCFDSSGSTENLTQQPTSDSLLVEQIKTEVFETIATIPVGEYSQVLVGEWQPTDNDSKPLVITKYGTMEKGYDKRIYKLSGNKVHHGYSSDIMFEYFNIELSQSETKYYHEIYNDRDYAGRYQRLK